MRSLIYRETGRLELVEKKIPPVGDEEVLIRMKYCGICGTDVHSYRNGLFIPRDTVMGHEIAGIIESAGVKVRGLKKGDRVIANPMPYCSECYWCRRGEYSLCKTALDREIGFHPEYDGGLQDFLLIRYPKSMILKIPSTASMEEAALVEPLATSLHAVNQSRIRKGDSALVIGAGMIGLGIILFLKLKGVKQIIVLEISKEKAETAVKLGAEKVIDSSSGHEEILQAVLAETDGIGSPVVFECAGVPTAFRDAPKYARKGGQVILAGFCETEVGILPLDWILREIEVKAILGYYKEFHEVLRFMKNKKIPSNLFITDTVTLEKAEENGFRRIMHDRNVIKILVDMEKKD